MILTVNAGSSSIKVELFDLGLQSVESASVTEIGGAARLKLGKSGRDIDAPDHSAAVSVLLQALEDAGHSVRDLTAAGHRVVHGGPDLTAPARLTDALITQIESYSALAPLHNPANLHGIRALKERAPDLPQVAGFDTAFHASNPAVATTYALPATERAKGIRRYGFHGLSYAGLVAQFGDDLPQRLLALHLGNGASACAILNGQSVATTMGYSPLDGLVMGTRPGTIDGMAVLRLVDDYDDKRASEILNRESGLKALAGTNDMAQLLARDDAVAQFAIEHFCYWAVRQAGSMIAAMQGLDAIAFTGGIGENAPDIRDRIAAGLAWAGDVPIHVIPAAEERTIAAQTLHVLGRDG